VRRSVCWQINAYLVLSVIGALFAIVQVFVAAFGAAATDATLEEYVDDYCECSGLIYCREVIAIESTLNY